MKRRIADAIRWDFRGFFAVSRTACLVTPSDSANWVAEIPDIDRAAIKSWRVLGAFLGLVLGCLTTTIIDTL